MAYGVKRIRYADAVWTLWQISGRITLPDPGSPGSDVVGFPQIEIYWQDSEQHGVVEKADQTAFIEYLLAAVVAYPNMTDAVGTLIVPSESPITPTA